MIKKRVNNKERTKRRVRSCTTRSKSCRYMASQRNDDGGARRYKVQSTRYDHIIYARREAKGGAWTTTGTIGADT